MPERLVVIGGDAAGMSAASQARRLLDADDLEIIAFERSSYVSFSACGEPYYVAGYVERFDDLFARSPEQFAAMDIQVRLHHEVVAIDTDARTVTVRDGDGDEQVTDYDVLMYSTGATAYRPPIEGSDLHGVHVMHTLDDALALRRLVQAGLRRAVVVGGGYIGLEGAEALHHSGVATTVVTAAESVLEPQFDPDMGRLVIERMREIGIEVHTGMRIERLDGRDGRVAAVRCDDRAFEADLVLLALGTRPQVALAEASGIALGASGGVWVDDRMRTRVEGVYAGGDCTEATHRVSSRAVNFHLGTVANKQGRIAGLNIGGADERFPGVLGTAITKVCELEISRTGLTEAEASEAGLDHVATAFDSTTATGYWPAAEPMRVKVITDRDSRRLLGAQIVGGAGAAKRIDAIAVALWNGMTVDAIVNVDLSYSPPFSGVWDPVLVAARKAQSALG